MNRNEIEDLLNRYLKNTASSLEINLVESWLNKSDPANSEWSAMSEDEKSEWLCALFEDIRHSTFDAKVTVMRSRTHVWKSIAAIAAVLLVCFIFYLVFTTTGSQLTLLSAPANQKKMITLSDGSKVWLNASAQLKYPKKFDRKTREVFLSGEAYFDVHHDAAKPFIIHTGQIVTTVLGTAFNIAENKNTHVITVTVTRGKVSVAHGTNQIGVLTPDEQISVNTLSYRHLKRSVDANKIIAWLDDEIYFDDITFENAAKQLAQRFKIKIGFSNDRLKRCRFSGTALKGDQLEKILKVLCAFNHATYQIKSDGNITIDGPGCD